MIWPSHSSPLLSHPPWGASAKHLPHPLHTAFLLEKPSQWKTMHCLHTTQTFKISDSSLVHYIIFKLFFFSQLFLSRRNLMCVRMFSCLVGPTHCNPMDCSTLGLPVSHYLLEFAQVHVHSIGDVTQTSHLLSLSSPSAFNFPTIRIFSNELSVHMGFPGQEYCSGLPFPSPGDLPNPGIKPTSLALAGGFFTSESPGKPRNLTEEPILSCPVIFLPLFAMHCTIPLLHRQLCFI